MIDDCLLLVNQMYVIATRIPPALSSADVNIDNSVNMIINIMFNVNANNRIRINT